MGRRLQKKPVFDQGGIMPDKGKYFAGERMLPQKIKKQ